MGQDNVAVVDIPSIPVIDFEGVADPVKRPSICAQVAKACETVGFFQIKNSQVPVQVLDDAFEVSRKFFDLPLEDKLKLQDEPRPFRLGYRNRPFLGGANSPSTEVMVSRHQHLSSIPAGKEISTCPATTEDTSSLIDGRPNLWPDSPRDYCEKMETLAAGFNKVADTLLSVLSESLGLPTTFLVDEYKKYTTTPRQLSCHRYLKAATTDVNETRLLPHRDSTVFTILVQGYDTAGLEISVRGTWIPLVPERGAIIINVGDILQVWSNARYKSVLHRVVSNNSEDRYSIVYFLLPTCDFVVKPIPELLTENNPIRYRPFTYKVFFETKINGEANKEAVSLVKTHEIRI